MRNYNIIFEFGTVEKMEMAQLSKENSPNESVGFSELQWFLLANPKGRQSVDLPNIKSRKRISLYPRSLWSHKHTNTSIKNLNIHVGCFKKSTFVYKSRQILAIYVFKNSYFLHLKTMTKKFDTLSFKNFSWNHFHENFREIDLTKNCYIIATMYKY